MDFVSNDMTWAKGCIIDSSPNPNPNTNLCNGPSAGGTLRIVFFSFFFLTQMSTKRLVNMFAKF